MIRKDVMLAILTTFCLCALMFTVIPIRSSQPYDPWADINDDGKINMYDIGNVASQFGTTGDSTKNVNVTNWQQSWKAGQMASWYVTWTDDNTTVGGGLNPSTDGYSKLYITFAVTNVSRVGPWSPNVTYVFLNTVWWGDLSQGTLQGYQTTDHFGNDTCSIVLNEWIPTQSPIFSNDMKAIEVKGPYFGVSLGLRNLYNIAPSGWMTVDVYYYLRND